MALRVVMLVLRTAGWYKEGSLGSYAPFFRKGTGAHPRISRTELAIAFRFGYTLLTDDNRTVSGGNKHMPKVQSEMGLEIEYLPNRDDRKMNIGIYSSDIFALGRLYV